MTDVTDELIAKLQARRDYGTEKYSQPLQQFDGRITELDIEEELLDALAYVTKMRMEREQIAELLTRVGDAIGNAECCEPSGEALMDEVLTMRDRLKADKWRIGGAQ